MSNTVEWFADLGIGDVERVGGKNASLGEMVQHLSTAGVRVPDGFATTATAYREFLAFDGLADPESVCECLGQPGHRTRAVQFPDPDCDRRGRNPLCRG